MPVTSDFYDLLLLNRQRDLYIKVELLSWNESIIETIEGIITSGSVSIDGNSSVRRNLSVGFILDKSNISIDSIVQQLTINKKFKAYVGVKNTTTYYNNPSYIGGQYDEQTKEIYWFKLGVFVPVDISYSQSTSESSISITAQDKMCLLNGEVAGELGTNILFINQLTNLGISYYDVIKNVVGYFGGIDESKILIQDLPIYADSLYRATKTISTLKSSSNRTFNGTTGAPLTSGTAVPTITAGDVIAVSVTLGAQSEEEKIEVSATETIASVLDKINERVPGQYEYFFDEDGNFIFRLKPSLKESTPPTGYFQEQSSSKYTTYFENITDIYDLTNKPIITSISNSPLWKGIKNDFYVYGKGNILYHIVIDQKPVVPSTFFIKTNEVNNTWSSSTSAYNQPWQQYIIDLTDYNSYAQENNLALIPNPWVQYYAELVKYFKYDSEFYTGIYQLKTVDRSQYGIWRFSSGGMTTFTGNTVATSSAGPFVISNVSDFSQIAPGKIVTGATLSSKYTFTVSSIGSSDISLIATPNIQGEQSAPISAGEGITFSISVDEFFEVKPEGNPLSWDYYFDIIEDSTPGLGQFSVNTIGKRVKTKKDEYITVLNKEAQTNPDYSKRIIIFTDTADATTFVAANQSAFEIETSLQLAGTPYVSILDSQIMDFLDNTDFLYSNDAYSNIKDLLYIHTAYNESLSLESIPMYNLQVNNKIKVLNESTEVDGVYLLSSISIPFTPEGTMSLSSNRIHEATEI